MRPGMSRLRGCLRSLGFGRAEPVPAPEATSAFPETPLVDPVTGLAGRAFADASLGAAFSVAELGQPLSIVLLQMDDSLGPVRRAPGEASGASLLRSFSGVLQTQARRGDIVTRYGEDEFLVILPDCSEQGALLYATRVQERLRAAQAIVAVPNVSIGIARYVRTQTSPGELLASAQGALLESRQAGGDRISIFGEQRGERVPRSTAAPSGRGRAAFVLTPDAAVEARVLHLLRTEEFAITEGAAATGSVPAEEFDVVCLDAALGSVAIETEIRALRGRSPAVRIVVLVQREEISPALLRLRADAFHVLEDGEEDLRAVFAVLLEERDSHAAALQRERQLARELAARERAARDAVAASEARLHTVLQNIQEVIFATDREGHWSLLNPAWSALSGFTVEESIGQPMFAFLHEDDRAEVRTRFEAVLHAGAPYFRHEGRWRTRTGAYRWLELRVQPTLAGREVEGTSGVLVDVTDRHRAEAALRQSEQYFRSMIENSADVVAAVNADGTIRYVSPAVEPLLGYAAGDWVGRTMFERLHPDDVPAALAEFRRLVEEPEQAADVELRMRHRDGHWLTLEMSGRNLLGESELDVIVISARDTTDRRRAAALQREQEEALLRAQKMDAIARFAGEVAQDLAPAVTTVQQQLDALRSSGGGATPSRELSGALARAQALVERLRTIGRTLPLEAGAIDLNALIVQVRDELDVRRLTGIEVVCRFAQDLRPARADGAHVTRVLRELLANARAALTDGGRIDVATRNVVIAPPNPLARELPSGEYALVTIADNGKGVPDAVFAQLFEPFVTTREEDDVRGVGLAEAFGIIKQSGGHMVVESAPGWGTLISVYLPVA